ncbi:hypothetical protein A3F07_02920 [candidate division WWE3 bacterium RIFCSPHIGHO2_12_FULL_38_15]|uniref:Uncharacterized protein n=1 Tax=candidate division WWE3 bacterium RIFCSPHIGHO2_02_FULL_38_14 TaxID=1802620 RepID=A0A1F4VAF5_UNCKA|nr:MAG: hypothetical protein A2793_01540 [candidate division WWE3 bacterium RIFCSPHIGHO2_01_FULL_38_45]OGC49427.1 MAG: hypothetical protein A3F07_02920 [candidate division WWE3 bacterium RIFCSPHIGHO2_12_FULL_38_15]OGC52763.1 MAG: hypothetical protein A3B64_01155 [candidate division WWE3 bacterium RIFCSPLOWO2_01_FULL_37_24]OGC53870.1 MAG: hypothetical protein A3D91_01380 [candidate division WWE3 bacterium RIFCSPHIGHO2_02_FULL_38_14]
MTPTERLVFWVASGAIGGLVAYFFNIVIRLPGGTEGIVTTGMFLGALIAMCLGAVVGVLVFWSSKSSPDDKNDL